MPAAAPAATSMVPAELQALVAPHIDSYNYFIGEGLQEVVQRLDPIEVITHSRCRFALPALLMLCHQPDEIRCDGCSKDRNQIRFCRCSRIRVALAAQLEALQQSRP